MSGGDLGVSAFPEGESIFTWIGTIEGGKGTAYEGLSYKLSLHFPMDYPFKPPLVKFETMCFHPNVDQYGNICLDILQVSIKSAGVFLLLCCGWLLYKMGKITMIHIWKNFLMFFFVVYYWSLLGHIKHHNVRLVDFFESPPDIDVTSFSIGQVVFSIWLQNHSFVYSKPIGRSAHFCLHI